MHALYGNQGWSPLLSSSFSHSPHTHKLTRVLWHLLKFKQPFNSEIFAKAEAKMKLKKLQRL